MNERWELEQQIEELSLEHKKLEVTIRNKNINRIINLLQSICVNEKDYTIIKNALDDSYSRFRINGIPREVIDNFMNDFNKFFGREPEEIEFIDEKEMIV